MLRIIAVLVSMIFLSAGSCPSLSSNTDRLSVSNYVINISELYSDGKLPSYVDAIAGLDPTEPADPALVSLVKSLDDTYVPNHNVALVGPAGTDSDARMWALAAYMQKGDVSDKLKGKQVFQIKLDAVKQDLRSLNLSSADYVAFIQRILNELGDQVYYISNAQDVAYKQDQYGVLLRFTRETGLKPEDLVKVFVSDRSDCVFSVTQEMFVAQFLGADVRGSIQKVDERPYTAEALFTYLEMAAQKMPVRLSRASIGSVAKATKALFTNNQLSNGVQILNEMTGGATPTVGEKATPRAATGDAALYAAIAQVSNRPVGNVTELFKQMLDGDSLDMVDVNVELDPTYYSSFPRQNTLVESVSRELKSMRELVVNNNQLVQDGIAGGVSAQAESIKPVMTALIALAGQVSDLKAAVDGTATTTQVGDVATQVAAVLARVNALPDAGAMAAAVAGENAKQTAEFQIQLKAVLDAVVNAISELEGKMGGAAGTATGAVGSASAILAQALADLKEQQAKIQVAINTFSAPIAAQLAELKTQLMGQIADLKGELGARLNEALTSAVTQIGGLNSTLQHQILLTQTSLHEALGHLNGSVREEIVRLQTDLLGQIADLKGLTAAQLAQLKGLLDAQNAMLGELAGLTEQMRTQILGEQRMFINTFMAELRVHKEGATNILQEMADLQTRLLQRAKALGDTADQSQQDAFAKLAKLQSNLFEQVNRLTQEQQKQYLQRLQKIYDAFTVMKTQQDAKLRNILQQMATRAQTDLAEILARLQQQKAQINGVLDELDVAIAQLKGLPSQLRDLFTQIHTDIQTAAAKWGENNEAIQRQVAMERQLLREWATLSAESREALLRLQGEMAHIIGQVSQTSIQLNQGTQQLQHAQATLLAQINQFEGSIKDEIAQGMARILQHLTDNLSNMSAKVTTVFASHQQQLLSALGQMQGVSQQAVDKALQAQQALLHSLQAAIEGNDQIATLIRDALQRNEETIQIFVTQVERHTTQATTQTTERVMGALREFQNSTFSLIQQLQASNGAATQNVNDAEARLKDALVRLNVQIEGVEGAANRLETIVARLNAQIALISAADASLGAKLQGLQDQATVLAQALQTASGGAAGLSVTVQQVLGNQEKLIGMIQTLTTGGNVAAARLIKNQGKILEILRGLHTQGGQHTDQLAQILQTQTSMLELINKLPTDVASQLGVQLGDISAKYATIVAKLEEVKGAHTEQITQTLQQQQEEFTRHLRESVERFTTQQNEQNRVVIERLTGWQTTYQTTIERTIQRGLSDINARFTEQFTQQVESLGIMVAFVENLADQQKRADAQLNSLAELLAKMQTTYLADVRREAYAGAFDGAVMGCQAACADYYEQILALIEGLPASFREQIIVIIREFGDRAGVKPTTADASTNTGADTGSAAGPATAGDVGDAANTSTSSASSQPVGTCWNSPFDRIQEKWKGRTIEAKAYQDMCQEFAKWLKAKFLITAKGTESKDGTATYQGESFVQSGDRGKTIDTNMESYKNEYLKPPLNDFRTWWNQQQLVSTLNLNLKTTDPLPTAEALLQCYAQIINTGRTRQ